VVSVTVAAAPVAVAVSASTSWWSNAAPEKYSRKPASDTFATVTVPFAGKLESRTPPLAVSVTVEAHAPVHSTIDRSPTSVLADAPANVTLKPVLPALLTAAPPAKPAMPLMAAATLALLMAAPPAPSSVDVLPLSEILKQLVQVAV